MSDRAAEAERLFGLRLEGVLHVGTPEAVAAAEAAIVESAVSTGSNRPARSLQKYIRCFDW